MNGDDTRDLGVLNVEEQVPTVDGSQSGVAKFSNFSFSNLTVNGSGPGLKSSEEIVLRQNGTDYSTPSAPNAAGTFHIIATSQAFPSGSASLADIRNAGQ